MSAHAEYGPSRLTYLAQCRAFKNQQNADTSAADRGTIQHHAMETGNDDALSPEETEAVQKVREYMAHLPEYDLVLKEVTLQIHLGRHHTFGTADFIGVDGEFAELIDYKFGRKSVPDAEENAQGKAYAIGVFQKCPEVKIVRVTFILPYRDEILRAVFYRRDLPRIRAELDQITHEAMNPNPPRTPCPACNYCMHKGNCGALANYALPAAQQIAPAASGSASLAGHLPQLPATMDPAQLSDETLSRVCLPAGKLLENWYAGVKDEIKRRHEEDPTREFPGAKVSPRHGKREIKGNLYDIMLWVADQMTNDQYEVERPDEDVKFILSLGSISAKNTENLISAFYEGTRGTKIPDEELENLMAQLEQDGLLKRHADYLQVTCE